jgi:hypothetical protein
MSKKEFILTKNVHFGTLKFSLNKGSKILIDEDNKKITIRDKEYSDVSEIELCIRKGFIIPFVEGETKIDDTIKTLEKPEENKKMEVEKSDVDNMKKDIDISNTKKEVRDEKRKAKMEVIREAESEDDSRGFKVIVNDNPPVIEVNNKDIMKVINGDDGQIVAKIPVKNTKPKGVPDNTKTISVGVSDADALEAINGEQGKIVKTIGKSANTKEVNSGTKLTTKKASKTSADKAKANAEARKKASEARRAKAQKGNK